MTELKTKRNDTPVQEYISSITNPTQQSDARELDQLMSSVIGEPGAMWGTAIVGYGSTTYTYANGKDNTWFKVGFSARKQNMTLYLWYGLENESELLAELGPHSTGKACLYIKKLDDINRKVLYALIAKYA